MLKNRFPVGLLPLLASAILGCPQKTAVWLAPGSSAEHLVFLLGYEVGHPRPVSFYLFRVDRCEPHGAGSHLAEPVWFLSRELVEPDYPPDPAAITYGEPPPGYEASNPAPPLAPGCYLATISGTGRARFQVLPGGEISELKESP